MNKSEFVNRLAERTGLTKKDSRCALDAMTELITEALSRNEEVLLTGFGKFEPRPRKESNRINPQTQERIRVPRKVVPAFKAGKSLKEAVMRNLRVVETASGLEVRRG